MNERSFVNVSAGHVPGPPGRCQGARNATISSTWDSARVLLREQWNLVLSLAPEASTMSPLPRSLTTRMAACLLACTLLPLGARGAGAIYYFGGKSSKGLTPIKTPTLFDKCTDPKSYYALFYEQKCEGAISAELEKKEDDAESKGLLGTRDILPSASSRWRTMPTAGCGVRPRAACESRAST